MPESREQVESSRAHHAHHHAHQKRRADALYNKLRRLENAIRDTIVVGEQIDADGLYALRQRVPSKPRPTLHELRNRRR